MGAAVGAHMVPSPFSGSIAATVTSRPSFSLPIQATGSTFDQAMVALRLFCQ